MPDLKLNDPSEDLNQLILKVKHLEVFDHIEHEFNKVKDFELSKLEIKDIKKHIKSI